MNAHEPGTCWVCDHRRAGQVRPPLSVAPRPSPPPADDPRLTVEPEGTSWVETEILRADWPAFLWGWLAGLVVIAVALTVLAVR